MAGSRTLVALTACALAFGGLAGAVFVALSGPVELGVDLRDRPARDGDSAQPPSAPPLPEVPGAAPVAPAASAASLTARLDDPDAGVRHELALELLRRGPTAYAQARALRPSTPDGRDLQSRLVLALDKMRLLRRSTDYPKLPGYLRERLDLDAFASVVPESLLLGERVSYWEQELTAVRNRIAKGHGDPAEESIALLEIALARREAGELAGHVYAERATELLPVIDAWIATKRGERNASPAEIRDLETQVARLRL